MDNTVAKLIQYITNEIIQRPGVHITPNSPLVSSGLVDSFALLDVLHKVDALTNTRIPASKVQPKDMDTVASMIATANRLGKPR